ncbi:MAG: AAA family ATPase [Deltaproteobacteria bacterium]|nr:AAA family ATPase [Deltaproteobacteria bacterium]
MTKTDYKKVALRLRNFMIGRGLSNNKIAQAINASPSAISQFLNNKYTGDNKTLANKIVSYVNSIAGKERKAKDKPGYIDTTVAIRVKALIANTDAFSLEEGKIGIIIGDGGHGKSYCLRTYAETDKNSVYVELDDAMTMRGVYQEIAAKIGLEGYGTLQSVTRRIIDNLQNRHIIILLDECSGLSPRQLNSLRQIIVVKSRCPLILAGNQGLRNTIMSPTTKRGSESLDQFTSRLMAILNLDEAAAQKDGGLYTPDDIRKLYQYGGIKLTGGAVNTLKKICRTPRSGRLRTCSQIITALHTASKIKKCGQITASDIPSAIAQLGLPVRVWLPINSPEFAQEEQSNAASVAG